VFTDGNNHTEVEVTLNCVTGLPITQSQAIAGGLAPSAAEPAVVGSSIPYSSRNFDTAPVWLGNPGLVDAKCRFGGLPQKYMNRLFQLV
jgi:hypothetical protein